MGKGQMLHGLSGLRTVFFIALEGRQVEVGRGDGKDLKVDLCPQRNSVFNCRHLNVLQTTKN